jgi:HEPN domain-containing protein
MTSSHVPEARQLFEAGLKDQLACSLLVESGRAPVESVGFLAQQACEKFIKCRVVLAGGAVSRTHDLEFLADLAEQVGSPVPADRNELGSLIPFAVVFRYEPYHAAVLDQSAVLLLVNRLKQWCEAGLAAASQG